jgi:3-isopropylmalate/(R)-2-methylmalate dehydratase large subunit
LNEYPNRQSAKERKLGRTISEKIFQAHSGKECRAGELVVARIDFVMGHDGNRPLAFEVFRRFGGKKVFNKGKVAYVIDHHTPAPMEANAEIHRQVRSFCAEQAILLYENEGICHQLIPEKGHALPGNLIIGSDSHTCTYGALNAFSTGVGSTDLAAGMLTGKLWFKVPQTIKIHVAGHLAPGVFSKDLILYIIGQTTAAGATYEAVEFVGPAISGLSIDERLTISNMAIEMGAKAGIMECDDKLERWIRARTKRSCQPVSADKDATYIKAYEFDASKLSPQIAKPHTVDNVVPIEAIGDVPIQIANLVSCTNGRLDDLAVAAKILKGKKVHPSVRLLIVPASRMVLLEGMRAGIIQTLEAGGVLRNARCAGCSGGAAFGTPGTGENVISTANRNFKGRLGNAKAFIYLASPATVAASAIEGKITDCRRYIER